MDRYSKKLTLGVVFLVQLFLCQGCNIFGFLANPGPFESGIPAEYNLKAQAERKILVWVEAMPSSGANTGVAEQLDKSILIRLKKKVGISEKYILTQDTLIASAYNSRQSPAELGRQVGAGLVFYVRLEEFEAINLHSNKIYSGRMLCRAVLIDSQNGQVLWPVNAEGIVTDVATELATNGRDELVVMLSESAAHCIVRHFYACSRQEYRVNEERSTLNEMIQQEVY